MIAYKLEWATQNAPHIELYLKREKALEKQKQLEESAKNLGLIGLNVWITEIEIIE